MSELRLADPAASWAVLAGVPHYDHLTDIPQVENNVAALGAALRDTGVWGLPADRIDIVKPAEVRDQFIAKAGEAARRATDTLIVYYAGHGLPDPRSDELYLGLPATERGYVDTALRYEFLTRRLAEPKNTVRNIVVILDCCYSGRAAINGRMSAGGDLADLAGIPGACLLAASAPTRTALAPVGATYTAFTGVLLETLGHGVPGGEKLLPVTSLYYQAFRRLSAQAPELRIRGSGDRVCFARNAGYTPTASATTPVTAASATAVAMAAPAAAPAAPTAPKPSTPVLVARRLEHLWRVKGFELVKPGLLKESRLVTKARQAHTLEGDEELIGVWQFRPRILNPPDSLAFTTRGVRISDGNRSIFIAYAGIRRYDFSCERGESYRVTSNSSAHKVAVYTLKVSGPDVTWNSPMQNSPDDIKDLAAALGDVQQLSDPA